MNTLPLEVEGQKLYSLKLHEGVKLSFGIFVMRVPGGWLYDCWDFEKDSFKNGTFVPFNNELYDTVLEQQLRAINLYQSKKKEYGKKNKN